jgi:hypothetical protein
MAVGTSAFSPSILIQMNQSCFLFLRARAPVRLTIDS